MEETLPRLILSHAARRHGTTALRHKEGGQYRAVPWEELEANVRRCALGLLALGLEPGERVAIMAPNGPEWVYADLGAMACGAVSVPVYHTERIPALLHILKDSGSRVLFLHSPPVARDLLPHLGAVPALEHIVLFGGTIDHPAVLPLPAFWRKAGSDDVIEGRLTKTLGDDLATIVYTSGTTGAPKGAMLSHRNILSNLKACSRLFDIGTGDECLSFLPLSHVFERMAGYYFMLDRGAVIAYAESIDSVPVNMEEVRPTVVISVPRLYEKMYARIMERVLTGPWLSKQLFFGALRACRAAITAELSGQPSTPLLGWLARTARTTIFGRLKKHLGGRLRFFVSGGAPLGQDIAEFFLAAGLPIYEGYGLTETAPVIAANTPAALRLGTVGRPIPGTEVRLAADGEIEVRGPGVFRGYWEQPEATAQAFDGDWFRTGDVGRLDADGYLAITDRKKDLIITAGGKNIAPQNLESLLKADKFIANALVYGDRKPYLTALLVPNLDNLEAFARQHAIDFLNHCDLVNHPLLLALLRERVDLLQSALPSYQRIKRFTLLSQDFSRDEITPTLKIKRKLVMQRFHKILEEMYLDQDHGVHDSGFCIVEEAAED